MPQNGKSKRSTVQAKTTKDIIRLLDKELADVSSRYAPHVPGLANSLTALRSKIAKVGGGGQVKVIMESADKSIQRVLATVKMRKI